MIRPHFIEPSPLLHPSWPIYEIYFGKYCKIIEHTGNSSKRINYPKMKEQCTKYVFNPHRVLKMSTYYNMDLDLYLDQLGY